MQHTNFRLVIIGLLALLSAGTIAWLSTAGGQEPLASVAPKPSLQAASLSQQAGFGRRPVAELVGIQDRPVYAGPKLSETPEPQSKDVPEKEEPSQSVVILKVKGAGEHLGNGDQGRVRITAKDPGGQRWSGEASLVNGQAQFAGLPEGPLDVLLSSPALEQSLDLQLTWSRAEAPKGEVELDLNKELAAQMQTAAIATLRSIAAAQQQLQASSAIDTDGDGGGEYGYLAELAGSAPMRIYSAGGPSHGTPNDLLSPPFLAKAFAELKAAGAHGAVLRNGYYYRVHLPGSPSGPDGPVPGLAEASSGGAGSPLPDPSQAEILWGCYAWPAKATTPPMHTFFINQEGDVLTNSGDRSGRYVGPAGGPAFDAALSAQSPGDMRAGTGVAAQGQSANDGEIWTMVSNN